MTIIVNGIKLEEYLLDQNKQEEMKIEQKKNNEIETERYEEINFLNHIIKKPIKEKYKTSYKGVLNTKIFSKKELAKMNKEGEKRTGVIAKDTSSMFLSLVNAHEEFNIKEIANHIESTIGYAYKSVYPVLCKIRIGLKNLGAVGKIDKKWVCFNLIENFNSESIYKLVCEYDKKHHTKKEGTKQKIKSKKEVKVETIEAESNNLKISIQIEGSVEEIKNLLATIKF